MDRDGKKDFWFPAKRRGLGWGPPVTWQGWVVVAVYGVVTVGGSLYLAQSPWRHPGLPLFILLTSGALLGICWLKGEKISWPR